MGNGQISWLKKIPLNIGPARSMEKIYTVPGLPILRRNVQVQSQSTAGTLRRQNIHLDPSPQAVLQVILRKWCGKILRSSALPKLSHQNRVKLLLWQITNRLVTGLDSTKTMCPHRCKATKIFPFYTCMCIDFLWKKINKREPFLSKKKKKKKKKKSLFLKKKKKKKKKKS